MIILVLLQFCTSALLARPTTTTEAEKAVIGWLKADAQPLNATLGQQVAGVETFTNNFGEPIYYIVYLQPSGFVIVSADDLVEPIIGFVNGDIYDPSPDNPLGALVTNDLNARIAAVRRARITQATNTRAAVTESQDKWNQLISFSEESSAPSATGLQSVSDPHVDPLVQSKWGQSAICISDPCCDSSCVPDPCCLEPDCTNLCACYNYYTPPSDPCDPCDYSVDPCAFSPYPYGEPNNLHCGCVATAMAQLMRYHIHPTNGIGKSKFIIGTSYDPCDPCDDAWTRGGDGLGGSYNWNDMVLVPDCFTTTAQRQAIGALCYDAGVSVNMDYSATGSTASLGNAVLSLKDPNIFDYNNAIISNTWPTSAALYDMINPNLDYNHPVILAVSASSTDDIGHAVLADGYGYNSSTLYHHINMGWEGEEDAWYNLPNVSNYHLIASCIYNIFKPPEGDGEIISGRVTNSQGAPISGATVIAQRSGGGTYNATTNSRGIYALANLPSASTYTIRVSGYPFLPQIRSIGTSIDYSPISGNKWAVDFSPSSGTPSSANIYVDQSATGNDDGSSWSNAYKYLQDALTDPCAVVIWVANGIYHPDANSVYPNGTGGRNASFALRHGLAIYGGYAGSGAADPNERDIETYKTILSGDLNGNDVHVTNPGSEEELSQLLTDPCRAENSYHVVTCNNADIAILDGCFITAGNADGFAWPDNEGGGMLNINANCKVNKCTFVENSSGVTGGAMANNSSNLQISNCVFFINVGSQGGGGVSSYQSSPTVVNCSFISNIGFAAGNNAGGLYNRDQSHATITNCLFCNNSAQWGGAVSNINGSNPTITNCTFYGNQATGGATGGINDYNNCYPIINNCILWGNTSPQIGDGLNSAAAVSYSDIQGGWFGSGISNINVDPCFIDPNGPNGALGTLDDNLRIWPSSACIDRGDNASVPADTTDLDIDGDMTEKTPLDLDRRPRFADGDLNGSYIVDMGAYEADLTFSGDLDGNNKINLKDFAVFANHWMLEFEPYLEERFDDD